MKTILIVATEIDENTGAIDDSNVTRVTGLSEQAADKWKADFKKFGDDQEKSAIAAGLNKSQIHQHRQHGKK
jgi:hypothetical protein